MPEVYAKKLRVDQKKDQPLKETLLEVLRSWVGERWVEGKEWFPPDASATTS